MIRYLRVEDFAVIDRVEVEFGPGLSALTGSTGAGKSLLVGAIGLVLGRRAGSLDLRAGAERAVVEAVFDPSPPVVGWLAANELPPADDGLVIRRVVGKGARCQIDGAAVPLKSLSDLGALLVDLHGQHEHQTLLRPESHVGFLDAFGGLDAHVSAYREAKARYDALSRRRGELARAVESARRERSLAEALLAEIRAAAPMPGELEALRARRSAAAHAEKLRALVGAAAERLSGEEPSVSDVLSQVERDLAVSAEIDPTLLARVESVREAVYRVSEVASDLRAYLDGIDADPAELERLEERIAEIRALTKKHDSDEAGLLVKADELAAVVSRAETGDDDLRVLDGELASAGAQAAERAVALHEARVKAGRSLSRAVIDELSGLGMSGSKFDASMALARDSTGEAVVGGVKCALGPDGVDAVEFLLASASGEELRPLSRVASGGEASRVMLAVKSALAEADPVPTLIFDEIDAGLGGEVADLVGVSLARLARRHQVLVITHLHQIASRADRHLRVTRGETKGRATVSVEELSGQARVDELTRMLSGGGADEEARAHAEALLDRARRQQE